MLDHIISSGCERFWIVDKFDDVLRKHCRRYREWRYQNDLKWLRALGGALRRADWDNKV